MNEKYLTEKIAHERNIKDNLWLSFIATFGASFALMLNLDNIFKLLLAIVGFAFSYILFNGYFVRLSKIENLLSKLK